MRARIGQAFAYLALAAMLAFVFTLAFAMSELDRKCRVELTRVNSCGIIHPHNK